MKTVWILQHLHILPQGEDCVKLIGVYATRDDAVGAAMRLAEQPGFRDFPNVNNSTPDDTEGFYIEEYEIGKDHWAEGFTTVSR